MPCSSYIQGIYCFWEAFFPSSSPLSNDKLLRILSSVILVFDVERALFTTRGRRLRHDKTTRHHRTFCSRADTTAGKHRPPFSTYYVSRRYNITLSNNERLRFLRSANKRTPRPDLLIRRRNRLFVYSIDSGGQGQRPVRYTNNFTIKGTHY